MPRASTKETTLIRPDVVSLFVDIDFDASELPHHCVHNSTGEPFTAEESALVASATRPEIEAARRYIQTAAEYHASLTADMDRLMDLVEPYAAGLPDSSRFVEVLARLPEDQRREAEEILDRVAPDGFVIRGEP